MSLEFVGVLLKELNFISCKDNIGGCILGIEFSGMSGKLEKLFLKN